MTKKPLLRPRFQYPKTLRALAIGLAIGFALPAFADNLPEVQRLIKQGQFPQAMEKVDAYLSSRPQDAQGRFLKGLIYTETNKPTEAIGVFTKLSEDYPELPEPYNNLAVLYALQKQYDKARTALEMAIRTHPSYTIAYENLGDVYAKLASQAYDKALHLDNSNTATQNKLALIHDLITTSGKGNAKLTAPGAVAAPPSPPATFWPVVAAAPTARVVSVTPPAASITQNKIADTVGNDIAKAIAAWASAWSRKDMKAYLAAYATDFNTPRGISRKSWESEREDRIAGKPGKISVTIDDPQITIIGDKATAKFHQYYTASGLNSSTTKTLLLVRSSNSWLIKEENAR